MTRIFNNIKQFRENRNLSQGQLAEIVGVRRETIIHLEKGRYNPSLELAMNIAREFDVTIEDIFYFVNEKEE